MPEPGTIGILGTETEEWDVFTATEHDAVGCAERALDTWRTRRWGQNPTRMACGLRFLNEFSEQLRSESMLGPVLDDEGEEREPDFPKLVTFCGIPLRPSETLTRREIELREEGAPRWRLFAFSNGTI
ncbi:MAG: hypothetical protein OXC11_13415 [Rhodospirillales bacterium]|nr:hypothetical protein [Rhodospirillales bacterium]